MLETQNMTPEQAAAYWKTRYELSPWKPMSLVFFALGFVIGLMVAP